MCLIMSLDAYIKGDRLQNDAHQASGGKPMGDAQKLLARRTRCSHRTRIICPRTASSLQCGPTDRRHEVACDDGGHKKRGAYQQ